MYFILLHSIYGIFLIYYLKNIANSELAIVLIDKQRECVNQSDKILGKTITKYQKLFACYLPITELMEIIVQHKFLE